jgi:hypothetical protein
LVAARFLPGNGPAFPQYTAKHNQHWAIHPPKVRLSDFLAGKQHGCPEFGVPTFEVGHTDQLD